MPLSTSQKLLPISFFVPLKKCSKCHIYFPATADFFTRSRDSKDGLYSQCKKCKYLWAKNNKKRVRQNHKKWRDTNRKRLRIQKREYMKQHRDNNPQYHLNKRLMEKYGISLKDFNNLKKDQENLCAICGTNETRKDCNGNIRRLSVDHNHKTGEVRGLLCDDCNNLLGRANDNIFILKRAIEYIMNHKKKVS